MVRVSDRAIYEGILARTDSFFVYTEENAYNRRVRIKNIVNVIDLVVVIIKMSLLKHVFGRKHSLCKYCFHLIVGYELQMIKPIFFFKTDEKVKIQKNKISDFT